MTQAPLRLVEAPDRSTWNEAITAAHGERVGLKGVVDRLDRQAVPWIVPASTAAYGFRWDRADVRDREWWPQGLTTSADAGTHDLFEGRHVVVVSWYAKPVGDSPTRGCRVTFVDITRPDVPAYRHVLLVQPTQDKQTGAMSWRPVRVHAGGIGWYGESLLVADTTRGIRSFRLADIVRVESGFDEYGYLLPQRTSYRQDESDALEPFRFSFLAVDRSSGVHRLDVGEYGHSDRTNRLAAFPLDQETRSFATSAGGPSTDRSTAVVGPLAAALGHMQGVVTVRDVAYISTSRGRFRRGTLWTRGPDGHLREHKATLAVGPEDLAYWPQREQLWCLSEYPGRRYVYAMPRSAFRA